MTRHKLSLLLGTVLVVSGCSERDATPSHPDALGPEHERPVVIVTNYPLYYFVDQISGGAVEIEFPGSIETDPAEWRPGPDDIPTLQDADLIFLNGATYEKWLNTVSIPSTRLVDTSAPFEDQLISVEGSVSHTHGPGGEHSHSETAFTTWMDLSLATTMTDQVHAGLATILPDTNAELAERQAALVADLAELDREFQAVGTALSGKHIIFSHPVYQYFEARYGLEGTSVHWEPAVAPSADDWAEFDHLVSHSGAAWMIWEDEPLPETLAMLSDRGIAVAVVSPAANKPETGDFLAVMKANVERLQLISAAP